MSDDSVHTGGSASGQTRPARILSSPPSAFTLIELVAVVATLSLCALLFAPALARTNPRANHAAACTRNLRTLTSAWQMYADENAGRLLAPAQGIPGRPVWIADTVEEIFATVTSGTLYPYTGKHLTVFRCPADPTKLVLGSIRRPSPRSYSMSHAFGDGAWLDGSYSPTQTKWRTFARGGEIVVPARTFLFLDEHPYSINGGAFVNVCTGAEPGDPPGNARIMGFPANYHNGGCNLAFTDGHVETHLWVGSKIRNAQGDSSGRLPWDVPAESSWKDIQWLASRTTVRR